MSRLRALLHVAAKAPRWLIKRMLRWRGDEWSRSRCTRGLTTPSGPSGRRNWSTSPSSLRSRRGSPTWTSPRRQPRTSTTSPAPCFPWGRSRLARHGRSSEPLRTVRCPHARSLKQISYPEEPGKSTTRRLRRQKTNLLNSLVKTSLWSSRLCLTGHTVRRPHEHRARFSAPSIIHIRTCSQHVR